MAIKPKQIALTLVALGVAAIVAGAALIYAPAALILGGGALIGFGLLAVDVESENTR